MFKLRTDKKSSIVSRRRPVGRFFRLARMRKAASIEEKKKALLKYLKEENLVPKRTTTKAISVSDDKYYSVNDMEFIVGTEDECFEWAKEDTLRLYEESGFDAFGEDIKNRILSNLDIMNEDRVYSWMEDDIITLVRDFESEKGRVKKELKNRGVNTKGMDEDDMSEALIDKMLEEWEPLEYLDEFVIHSMDSDSMRKYMEHFGFINEDAMAEYLVNNESSVPNQLASYDGEEIDLGNDLYAYRV